MRSQDFHKFSLPDAPGVYFFLDSKGEVIYIGRATSLYDRLKSYFSDDVIKTRGPLIVDMVTRSAKIEWIETDSVLDAIILESNLIKKHQPHANVAEKDDKSFNYVVITKEAFPRVLLLRAKELESEYLLLRSGSLSKNLQPTTYNRKAVFGPYPAGGILKDALKIIRHIFPYRDRCEPAEYLKKRKPSAVPRPCFERQIGLCPGVCSGEVSMQEYARTISHITMFFKGKKKMLLKRLVSEMKRAAKQLEFERASELKRTMFALTHIRDMSLIKSDEDHDKSRISDATNGTSTTPGTMRIEAYDVAHLGGGGSGGVMTVLEDRHLKKSDYRMFSIRRANSGDDIAALREVLDRRLNHPEWLFPDVVVVDGGIAQRNAARDVLARHGVGAKLVSVVKDDRHKPVRIEGDPDLARRLQKEIFLLNSEAHRFAIKYHRRKMRRGLLDR